MNADKSWDLLQHKFDFALHIGISQLNTYGTRYRKRLEKKYQMKIFSDVADNLFNIRYTHYLRSSEKVKSIYQLPCLTS